jgi:hypothetical protein
VLNPFDAWEYDLDEWMSRKLGRKHWRSRKAPAHLRPSFARGYSLLINDDHAGWLDEIEAAGAEMIFATMWMESAATDFAPELGTGHHWPHIPFRDYHDIDHWRTTGAGVANYKMPGVKAHAGTRPILWIDDDLTPDEHAWAERRTAAGFPTVLIQPDPAVGMTREHVEQVLDFVAEHSPATV